MVSSLLPLHCQSLCLPSCSVCEISLAIFGDNPAHLILDTPQRTATIASLPRSRLSQLSRTLQRTMAATSSTDGPALAPWRKQFEEHLGKMDSPEFVFSSLHPASNKDSPVPYVPRARFCIHRGFWSELPENKHNDAPKNERVFESDMPTFTTDVRMQKTFELFNSSSGHADREELVQGSGGGGPVEAVYWAKEVMVQWRYGAHMLAARAWC